MDDPQIIIGWRSALIFAVCLPILISGLILMFRRLERRANIYLGLALIAAVWSMGPQIIGFANAYTVWPGLSFFPFNAELLIPVLVYLHAYTLMVNAPLGWRKTLLIPGCLAMVYYLIAYIGLGDYQNKWAFNRTVHSPYIEPLIVLITIAMCVVCLWLTLSLIRRYQRFLKETESAARDYDPVWLIWIFGGLGFAGLIWVSLAVISLINPDISYISAYPFHLVTMIIFAALGFLAISRINMVFPKIGARAEISEQTTSEKDWKSEGETLKQKVLNEGWYLEPRLSIRDVASRMGSNETYISRALNHGVGQSFNRFINEMRVTHAKGLIKSGANNILNVAMDSGFNSKATFNRVFRDVSGETPSSFKSRIFQNVS